MAAVIKGSRLRTSSQRHNKTAGNGGQKHIDTCRRGHLLPARHSEGRRRTSQSGTGVSHLQDEAKVQVHQCVAMLFTAVCSFAQPPLPCKVISQSSPHPC